MILLLFILTDAIKSIGSSCKVKCTSISSSISCDFYPVIILAGVTDAYKNISGCIRPCTRMVQHNISSKSNISIYDSYIGWGDNYVSIGTTSYWSYCVIIGY